MVSTTPYSNAKIPNNQNLPGNANPATWLAWAELTAPISIRAATTINIASETATSSVTCP